PNGRGQRHSAGARPAPQGSGGAGMTAHDPFDDALDRDALAARLGRIENPPVPPSLVAQIMARTPGSAGQEPTGTRRGRRPGVRTLALVAAVVAVAVVISATTTPIRSYVGDLLIQMG